MTFILITLTTGCILIEELLPKETVAVENTISGTIEPEPVLEEDSAADSAAEPAQEPTSEPVEPEEDPEPVPEPEPEPAQEPEDTGGPSLCDENNICTLTITNPETFGCDSTQPEEIVFSNSGSGSLFVYHKSIYNGCCPEFSATATANLNNSTIDVSYTFANDLCDCVCQGISVRYTLSDIPAGSYQLNALSETVSVSIQ